VLNVFFLQEGLVVNFFFWTFPLVEFPQILKVIKVFTENNIVVRDIWASIFISSFPDLLPD
jgi:hypothetical protein